MKNETGERLFKAVNITVFTPENKKRIRQSFRAPARQGLTADGIDKILLQAAEKIEKSWPTEEYSLVPLGPADFNFVWRARKAEVA
jgi:hypothetical protein